MDDYKNSPTGKAVATKYADIIHLSRPVSRRPKMDHVQRAKIFAPYDALRGFDEAIENTDEKEREVARKELSDEQKEILSGKLRQLSKGMKVSVLYFAPDPTSTDGKGTYATFEGTVMQIDPFSKILKMEEPPADTTGGKIEKKSPIVIRFNDLKDVISIKSQII